MASPEAQDSPKAKRLRRAEQKDEEAQHAARSEKAEPEDKAELKSLRRAADKPDEEEPAGGNDKKQDPDAQALRRAEAADAPEDEIVTPLRRAEAVEKEDDDKAQPLRPAATKEEDQDESPAKAQAVRRANAAGDEEAEEAKPLRRAARLQDPEDAPRSEETREEPEPNQLTALRRDLAFGVTTGPAAAAPAAFQESFAPMASPGLPSRAAESFERPTVQIDRLDVLVQEPATAATRVGIERSRTIRARYLRRL